MLVVGAKEALRQDHAERHGRDEDQRLDPQAAEIRERGPRAEAPDAPADSEQRGPEQQTAVDTARGIAGQAAEDPPEHTADARALSARAAALAVPIMIPPIRAGSGVKSMMVIVSGFYSRSRVFRQGVETVAAQTAVADPKAPV